MKTTEHASTNISLDAIDRDGLERVTGGIGFGIGEAIRRALQARKIDSDIERNGDRPTRDGEWRPS